MRGYENTETANNGIFLKKITSVWNNRKVQNSIMGYLMLSPKLIAFFVFTLYPMLWVIKKSFYYYTGIDANLKFIGLENYINALRFDPAYWKAWLTTIEFAIIKLPIELPLAMFLAVLLNRKLKGRDFFRSLFFMPTIISVAIVGLIFSNMFDYFGFVNTILEKIGVISGGIDWLSTKKSAMTLLVIGSVWCSFGLNVLYFLAGLQNISEDLYEAAQIDGATSIQTFWKITLPLMLPVLQVVILLALNGTLHTNDYVIVMTNGAPGGQTNFIVPYLTKKFMPGFAENAEINIGYGSAIYMVTSFINTIIAIIYFKLSNKLKNLY